MRTTTPRWGLFYRNHAGPSDPSTPCVASFASINLRYVFTFQTHKLQHITIENIEFHCRQLFCRYIYLVTTLMLDKLLGDIDY